MQTSASLLGQFSVLTLGLIALSAFATALFHSVGGFAGALLLSVCLAPLLGVQAVVPVVAVAMVISNVNRLWLFRRSINWAVYRAVMVTGLPGIVLGAVIYLYLPVRAIAIVLGIFLVLSIPLRRALKKRNFKVGLRGLSVVGIGYGVMSGTVFGAGMILGPFLLGAGVIGEGLVGLVAALGLTLNVTKSVVFGAGQLLDPSLLTAGLVIGIFTIPGGIAGRYIVQHTDIRIHTVFIETLLLCGGCYFIYQGVVPTAGPGG